VQRRATGGDGKREEHGDGEPDDDTARARQRRRRQHTIWSSKKCSVVVMCLTTLSALFFAIREPPCPSNTAKNARWL
jgi:hypothetical protein